MNFITSCWPAPRQRATSTAEHKVKFFFLLILFSRLHFDISDLTKARKLYHFLSPLRYLLKAEQNPILLDMLDNFEARKDTILYCFNEANVVKFLHGELGLKERFPAELIQRVCGALDTNCYDQSHGHISVS